MNRIFRMAALVLLLAVAAGVVVGQRTAREVEEHGTPTPEWKNEEGFKKDVFTFVRIKYSVGDRKSTRLNSSHRL